jgi:hypothetical protein
MNGKRVHDFLRTHPLKALSFEHEKGAIQAGDPTLTLFLAFRLRLC